MSRKWSKNSPKKISREHQWLHYENLFKVQHDSVPLEKEQAELFHTVTMQGLFLYKPGHLDIAPAIAYLTTQVQKPNFTDWTKLCLMLQFLK